MAVLWIHSGELWHLACEARKRAAADVKKDSRAWPPDSIVAILLSALTAEAFINELAESILFERLGGHAIGNTLCAFADIHTEIEGARGSVILKYLMASQTLSGTLFDKGASPFQDFAMLIKLRDDLVHLNPKGKFVVTGPGSSEVKGPKYVQDLEQRGLARKPDEGVMMSWFNRLQTAEMADWACKTAHAIIVAVLDFIPDDPAIPILRMLKTRFQREATADAPGERT